MRAATSVAIALGRPPVQAITLEVALALVDVVVADPQGFLNALQGVVVWLASNMLRRSSFPKFTCLSKKYARRSSDICRPSARSSKSFQSFLRWHRY